MAYAVLFVLLGVAMISHCAARGGGWWIGCWPGVSFVVVGCAYAARWHGAIGKREDGSMNVGRAAFFLPYLLLSWGLWYIARAVSRQPASHEVEPGLWLGRYPLTDDIPPHVAVVVDLTAEFPRSRSVQARHRYFALPTLDATTSAPAALLRLVQQLQSEPGPLLVHCASGAGRSATFAAALLIARGQAPGPDEAERRLRAARPVVRLNRGQRILLRKLAPQLRASRVPDGRDATSLPLAPE